MTDGDRVVIVGGGITGLAAAFRLQAAAPDVETVLIECDKRPGGKILTERIDGFVIEGGPDSFLSSKPGGLGLCRAVGLEDGLVGPNEARRRTFVMAAGRLHDLPEGLTGLVPSRLEPLLASDLFSAGGKDRLEKETRIPPRPADGDESLASFVERRFGREVYERLIEPLMAGIYAGDGEDLSLQATFPQLRCLELQHGSVIRGLQAEQVERNSAPTPARARPGFLTPRKGMAEIVKAVLSRLRPNTVIGGRAVRQIEDTAGGYRLRLEDGESLDSGAVILATPAFAAAELLAGLNPGLAATLAEIPYVSTATISVAYPLSRIRCPLNGFGYIVPRIEGRPILACTWTSSKFPGRAPEGFGLIRCFVGRAGQEEAIAGTDADLLALVREEVRDVMGIVCPPLLSRVYRWPKAMPQYALGHLDRLTGIAEGLERHPGLWLAGHAYRGVGIPDCIHSGESAATAAAHFMAMPKAERMTPRR